MMVIATITVSMTTMGRAVESRWGTSDNVYNGDSICCRFDNLLVNTCNGS